MARKILLADDSVTAQNMGRRILTEAGYEVITVNNGSAALKKIAEAKPDLIVLDVYMPGYGGLEVCQRIREAPETARIPVLLTVGKLEPFKADEARRVRADAFIIKPFEASELLTALTKLEDKIVPHGQPYKPGRFAKAIAAAEESYGLGKEFGNPETGWKDRLSIPPHPAKHQEPEPEAPTSKAGFRDFGRSEDRKPADSISTRETATADLPPSSLAPDAIPAAFRAQSEEADDRPASGDLPGLPGLERVARTEEAVPEPAAVSGTGSDATFAPSREVKAATPAEPSALAGAEFAVETEQTAHGEPEILPYVPADPEPMAAATSSDSGAHAALLEAPEERGEVADDEVAAALASLAPANGDWDRSAIGLAAGEADRAPAWTNEQVLATMAATAGATPQYSGPRWIAEAVPVTEDESTLILEQEMARAYAAFAAADAAGMDGVACTPETNMPETGRAEDFAPAANPESVPPPSVWPYRSDASGSQPEQEASLTAPDLAMTNAAMTNAAESNLAVTNLAESNLEESSTAGAELPKRTEPPLAETVSSIVSQVEHEAAFAEAAFAAAASASASDATLVPAAATPLASEQVAAESVQPALEHGEHHRESELAAAWANWRHIRESVIGSELPSQVAEATAAGFREIRPEPAAPASQEPRTETSDTADESTAIASIVDSVLADLKPKLMEEIAKKMSKEPKKK